MAVRPITFTGPMVRAILDGRKTQTRRVLKPQPEFTADGSFTWGDRYGLWPDDWFGFGNAIDGALPHDVNDLLWVKEEWRPILLPAGVEAVEFKADGAWLDWYRFMPRLPANCPEYWRAPSWERWRSSRYMPRWASRITLRVTDVRVQRVQDISSADAIAEGIARCANSQTIDCDTHDPRKVFGDLWDSINAKRGHGWEANPWVAAYTFEPIMKNVDEVVL